jgi:anti-sigma regulatory factor (Ser/Thr protein kinase)
VTAPIRWRFEPADAATRLREASDELDRILAAQGVSERARFAARLVAEEIVLNAFEHGGATVVTMAVDPAGDPHRLILEDDGDPFDPAAPQALEATPNPGIRGRGLILVRGMTRSIEHRSFGGRNRLSILLVES